MHLLIAGAALALVLTFAPPARAATVVDFGPVLKAGIDYIIPIAVSAVAGFLAMLLNRMASAVGYNLDNERRKRLQEIVERGVAYAARLALDRMPAAAKLDLRSEIVAEAARYVAEHGAQTIRGLKGDPANDLAVIEIVEARGGAAIDAALPK